MEEKKVNEILQYLKDKTPIVYDLESQDLKLDRKSIYFKIYKCVYDLKEENKKLRGK